MQVCQSAQISRTTTASFSCFSLAQHDHSLWCVPVFQEAGPPALPNASARAWHYFEDSEGAMDRLASPRLTQQPQRFPLRSSSSEVAQPWGEINSEACVNLPVHSMSTEFQ